MFWLESEVEPKSRGYGVFFYQFNNKNVHYYY